MDLSFLLLVCKEANFFGVDFMTTKITLSDFDTMFEIMEKSFPVDERRPYREQKELFNNSCYKVYVKKEKGVVIAFVAVWDFENFLFIEHFAVNPEFRNNGIGGKLLGDVISLYDKAVCLEVEPPEDELTKRRIGFYKRNGFFLNEYPYTQPPISKGKNSIPLMIMSSGQKLCETEFENVRDVLYREVYKCL